MRIQKIFVPSLLKETKQDKTKQTHNPSYFSAAKKASLVTINFGAVPQADRWKCAFLERPDTRQTFVKYEFLAC